MNAHRPRDARPLAESDLHDYQRFCVEFIEAHPQCGVFLDMGLGKTAIALTAVSHLLYDSFEVSRVLIIAPLRVARDTWIAELDKWEHLTGLRLERVLGTPKERIAALSRRAELYIINRENVEWLVKHYAGRKLPFDMLVIDELSSFKNSRAKRFLALKKVLPQFTRVVGLTGTPAPNGLEDLWPQIYLLDRGARLGRTMRSYLDMYFDTPNSWTALQARAQARRGGGHLPAHRRISACPCGRRTTSGCRSGWTTWWRSGCPQERKSCTARWSGTCSCPMRTEMSWRSTPRRWPESCSSWPTARSTMSSTTSA